MRIPRIFLPVSVVVLFASLVYGQGVATGDLHITVKDPQGNLVTNATVTVRDEAKGLERPAASNGSGEYSSLALPPASYAVTVTASGFATATAPGVVITVGLYLSHCADCHGANGHGSWRATMFLIRPGDLGDARTLAGKSDEYLFDLIKNGGAAIGKPGMPAFGFHLTDEQIRELIRHVRALPPR
jgi:mono/diheme cytochrome c family protein